LEVASGRAIILTTAKQLMLKADMIRNVLFKKKRFLVSLKQTIKREAIRGHAIISATRKIIIFYFVLFIATSSI
jgi:hypothetical protein